MTVSTMLSLLAQGFVTSLLIFALTLLFSMPLGLVVMFGRRSRFTPLRGLIKAYISIMRGTPLMLQLMFVFYALPRIVGIQFGRMPSAIIAFSLNYAAYFAEIYRGGIEAMPAGQYEAAQVLGLTRGQTFFRIILPQVVKHILPPMGNEFITLVKDTSLAQTIVIFEIMKITERYASSTVSVAPFVVAALFYLVMNGIVSQCFSFAEKKLNYYR